MKNSRSVFGRTELSVLHVTHSRFALLVVIHGISDFYVTCSLDLLLLCFLVHLL